MNDAFSIGARIRQERKRLSMTQDDLAQVMGVSRASVATYEADRSSPDLHAMNKARDVGFDVWWILTGSKGNPHQSKLEWQRIRQIAEEVHRWMLEHQLPQSLPMQIQLIESLYTKALSELGPDGNIAEEIRKAA